ncbi:phage holin family protein [Alicyclobacillus vulcanalis]|uniref:4 TMS phage holin, superfamily IV n=1 Tax=Alicyclobacillus vulcanalis TaxID=252246 RepID=A0A1N7P4N3_9BACL|nr:phage holin family protein [Alicyclobacillus vulcanalis]SIT05399.1 4 TMS phage holin, superfamily IV [Alicyclobacillus vulcanalis]
MRIIGHIVRFVVSALVLLLVSHLVHGFYIHGFWRAVFAAIVITLLGLAMEALFGQRISPYGRGIIGFIASAVVIYVAQIFVHGMHVSVLGALLAALVIGIIDLFIPTSFRRE